MIAERATTALGGAGADPRTLWACGYDGEGARAYLLALLRARADRDVKPANVIRRRSRLTDGRPPSALFEGGPFELATGRRGR